MISDPKAEQILRNKARRVREHQQARARLASSDRAPISDDQFGIRAEPQIHQREQARNAGDDPHGPGWYQRPLPGLGHLIPEGHETDNPWIDTTHTLPVDRIFKHPMHDQHPAEYDLVQNYEYEDKKVRTTALRPTQANLNEHHLHAVNEGVRQPHPMQATRPPGAIKDEKGHYLLVDGHHRVARDLLNGKKTTTVRVWDVKALGQ